MRRPPLVEMRNIRVSFGGVHAVDGVTRRSQRRRGRRAGRRKRRREVHADPRAVRRASAGRRRDLHRRREGLDHESAGRAEPRDRDDLPDARARRQRRCSGEPLPRPGADDAFRLARRRRHGVGDARGHGPAEPEVPELQGAGRIAVGRPAPVGCHRARGPLQRPNPDHGRADGGPRAGRDRAGARARQPAEGAGDRDLPHQPRHPRRLRSGGPDQRHATRASWSAPWTRTR